jgi:hypothetical protein
VSAIRITGKRRRLVPRQACAAALPPARQRRALPGDDRAADRHSATLIRNWTGNGGGSGADQGATCARAGVEDAARAAKAEAVRFVMARHLQSGLESAPAC